MKKILRVVITGGPCGGKTTALEEISKSFRTQGYKVIIVPETATILINGEIKPFGSEIDRIPLIPFQEIVLDIQLAKEYAADKAAEACLNEKVAILYDRGILDNRAYITDEEFKEMIDKRGITEAQILSRYDIVLHLVTAAKGKEEFYTTENNTARFETPAEAREKDKRTMETWSNHPNLVILGNDCLFDEKIKRAVNAIRRYMGEDQVIDQRKYKVGRINYRLLSNYPNIHMLEEEIDEFVTCYSKEYDELYRKSTIAGSSYYTCTRITYHKNGTKTTIHKNITEDIYEENRSKIDGEPISKIRYNFIYNGERYRLDEYGEPTNLATLERDITDPTNTKLPEFVRVRGEITNDRDYCDANIYTVINKKKKELEKKEMCLKLELDV